MTRAAAPTHQQLPLAHPQYNFSVEHLQENSAYFLESSVYIPVFVAKNTSQKYVQKCCEITVDHLLAIH